MKNEVKVPTNLINRVDDYISVAERAIENNKCDEEMLSEAITLLKEMGRYIPNEIINKQD